MCLPTLIYQGTFILIDLGTGYVGGWGWPCDTLDRTFSAQPSTLTIVHCNAVLTLIHCNAVLHSQSAAGGGGRQACSRVTSMDLDNEVLTLASRSARRTPSIQAKDARTVAGRVPSPVALTPRMSPIEENVTSAIRESREKYQERKAVGLQSLDATPIPTPTGTPPNWADGHMPSHPPSTLSRTALRTAMAADDVALATQIIAATETEV